MTDSAADLSHFVPGFDFLQALVKGAGAAMPSIGQWVAPTLDPQEIDKRIEELRTVKFWLEQNARMLSATIQALEVQRMTLSTLRTMNVQMSDLRDSMMIRPPQPPAEPEPAPYWMRPAAWAVKPEPEAELDEAPDDAPAADPDAGEAGDNAANEAHADPARPSDQVPLATVDPMQWWAALTKQFTELAAAAIKETAVEVPRRTPVAAAARAAAKAAAKAAARKPRAAAKKARRKRAAAKKRAAAAAPPEQA